MVVIDPREANRRAQTGEQSEGRMMAQAAKTLATAPITDANPTVAEMEARVARFARLEPTADYVDALIPGFERTTWRVIGTRSPAESGAANKAAGDAPLAAEHFHLNLVRCAPGKAAPLHNHLTQEVFMALEGEWEVFWGPEGSRALRLARFDVVSVPPGVSRGFRNVGPGDGLLMGIAGGLDPGMINWPAPVRAAAAAAGVMLPVFDADERPDT
jgi:mannose-6-phosphate isomerase-like protein (cupin superfamily)